MNAVFSGAVIVLAVIAALRPLCTTIDTHRGTREYAAMPWPAQLEGRVLQPAALLPIEEKFAATFPGVCAAFSDGPRRIVMRWTTQPTRKLHPAEDCLKAAGFSTRPRPAQRHAGSDLWGSIEATHHGDVLQVREQITSADGQGTWTDVSAWFWSALAHPEQGPWLAITVIEPLPSPGR